MKRRQAERRAELVRAMPKREGVLFLKGKNYETTPSWAQSRTCSGYAEARRSSFTERKKLWKIRANSCKFVDNSSMWFVL